MNATTQRLAAGLAVAVLAATAAATAAADAQERKEGKKPQLTLRANPKIAFVPAKVQFTAQLEGGDDDYREFYCPSVEWDWDDETRSESTPDCEPYEPGKSRISRRYTAQHTFQFDGLYEVKLRLKQRGQTVASVAVPVEIRGGAAAPDR